MRQTIFRSDILQRDERRSIVYAIREEIFDKAWKQCSENYFERQTIKFTVQCAYTALTEIINLYFYPHDGGSPYYDGHPVWTPNKPPEPSPPDSWAACKVRVSPKKEDTEVELMAPARDDTKYAAATSFIKYQEMQKHEIFL